MNPPPYLSECDPESRTFPLDWKWAYYRLAGGIDEGFFCPMCNRRFVGPDLSGFEELHGDHVVPWKRGGRTTWDNLQLLCGPCNWKKSGVDARS
jgi:5-methylcytosine-specific restriction endonuclease McrA